MKQASTISRFFLSNPFRRGMIEWLLLAGSGICGWVYSWPVWSVFPYTNMLGGALIAAALWFHVRAEKDHRQAHESSDRIEEIVISGLYARIRHPLYLSLMMLNLGIALFFGIRATLVIALFTLVHWAVTALEEEKFLLKQFPEAYLRYRASVPWRMIPGIF